MTLMLLAARMLEEPLVIQLPVQAGFKGDGKNGDRFDTDCLLGARQTGVSRTTWRVEDDRRTTLQPESCGSRDEKT